MKKFTSKKTTNKQQHKNLPINPVQEIQTEIADKPAPRDSLSLSLILSLCLCVYLSVSISLSLCLSLCLSLSLSLFLSLSLRLLSLSLYLSISDYLCQSVSVCACMRETHRVTVSPSIYLSFFPSL